MKKIGLSILAAMFLITSLVYAAEKEKIAVAAEGKTAAAKVSGVAGRSPYFLLFDGAGKFLQAVDNPYKSAKGGAGTSVGLFLAQKEVTVVVAGDFGEKMIQALREKGIRYLEFKGTAEEVLKKILEAKK